MSPREHFHQKMYFIKSFPIFSTVIFCAAHLFYVVNGVQEYTKQELVALKKFRPLVQTLLYRDYMKEDKFLIRWLRARDLNIFQAKSMLAKMISWRRENKIDTILNETILTFPVKPYYHDGVSYSGKPVSVFNLRAYDLKNLILAGKRAELVRFMDQALEIGESGVRYFNEKINPYLRDIYVIWDFNGYNQRQHGCLSCILVAHEWVRHYENYYPQLMKSNIIINAPRIIKPMLNAFKPFLSLHTQEGLKVFGQNKKEWSTELFKIIPRNQLRTELGGTKRDYIPCAVQDFDCMCRIFFNSAGQGTNTTISLAAGLRKLDADLC